MLHAPARISPKRAPNRGITRVPKRPAITERPRILAMKVSEKSLSALRYEIIIPSKDKVVK